MLMTMFPLRRSAPTCVVAIATRSAVSQLLLVVFMIAIGHRPPPAAGPTAKSLQHDAATIFRLELVACLAPLPAGRIESLAQRTGPAPRCWTPATAASLGIIRGRFVCWRRRRRRRWPWGIRMC